MDPYSWGVVVVVASIYMIWRVWSGAGRKLPPGPRPLPVIGNILHLSRAKTPLNETLCQLAKIHGPLMTLHLGFRTTVVASSPGMAKEILKTHDPTMSARTVLEGTKCLSYNLHSLVWRDCVPRWRTLRRICATQLFSPNRLQALQHLRTLQLSTMIRSIYDRSLQEVDIGHAAFLTSLNLLGNMVFSRDMFDRDNSEKSHEFKDALTKMMVIGGAPNLADFFPFLRFLDPQGVRSELTGYFKIMFGIFDRYIEERLQSGRREETEKDFLDILLESKTETGENFSQVEITRFFYDLFTAGSETNSSTIEWAMAELIRSPETMKKLKEEVDKVVGKERMVQENDINNLPYLHAVVQEVLRLHPPAPLLIHRRAQSTCEINGFVIPKNTQVFVNAWAIGRDPVAWKDPERFFPERFIESKVEYRGQNFEFIPFGSGRRICPGLPLAHQMVHVGVVSLVHCFDWHLPNGKSVEMLDMGEKFGITLQKEEHLIAIPIPCLPRHIFN